MILVRRHTRHQLLEMGRTSQGVRHSWRSRNARTHCSATSRQHLTTTVPTSHLHAASTPHHRNSRNGSAMVRRSGTPCRARAYRSTLLLLPPYSLTKASSDFWAEVACSSWPRYLPFVASATSRRMS